MNLRSTLLAAAMTALAACQQPATGPNYKGEPLFTVKGEMALTGPTTTPTGAIRLAVAWYPDTSSASAPSALVTQEVQYQGTFPLAYSFSFFNVPPAAALSSSTSNGVTTRYGYGVLLAYEDLNGNGQLDTIAAGGSPVDRVLGTSLGDRFNGQDSTPQSYVVYVDGTPPADWTGYSAGYQLWQDRAIVPATTQVPLPLHLTNELNYFVCEEFIGTGNYGWDLPCHIAPTGGVRVIGNVYASSGQGAATLRITDGTNPLTNVAVEVNGTPIGYDAVNGLYSGYGFTVHAPGRNVVRVTAPGQAARVFEMDAPGEFTIPAPNGLLRTEIGSNFDFEWTRATGASFYSFGGSRNSAPYTSTSSQTVYERGQAHLSGRITEFAADDYYSLQVAAYAPNYLARGLGGSMVNSFSTQFVTVDSIPAARGLRLEGSVNRISYQGQEYGQAYVQVFDSLTELTSATVSVDGTPLAYNSQYAMFSAEPSNLVAGATSTFSLSGNGKPQVQTTVALPGDFTVNAVPASLSKSAPYQLQWTASADAENYRVWVSDDQGQTLFSNQVTGTSLTIPALGSTGYVAISVAAIRSSSADRHLIGSVQKTLETQLVP